MTQASRKRFFHTACTQAGAAVGVNTSWLRQSNHAQELLNIRLDQTKPDP